MRNDPPPDESELYVPRKASSDAWKSFRLSTSNPTHVWCTVCKVWLAWKKTTSNLLLHCNSRHSTTNPLRKRQRDEPPPPSRTRPRLTSSPTTDDRHVDFKKATAHLLIEDFLPPSIVKGSGFTAFCSKINRRYRQIPQTILFKQLETIHANISKKIAALLELAGDRLSLAVELWGDDQYASVTAHFLLPNHNFRPVSALLSISRHQPLISNTMTDPSSSSTLKSLCTDQQDTKHNANHLPFMFEAKPREQLIVKALQEALQVWRLPTKRIVSVTTTSEVLCGAQLQQICGVKTHLLCLSALLNRIMHTQLKNVSNLITQCCKVVGANVRTSEPKNWVVQARILQQISNVLKMNFGQIGDDNEGGSLSSPKMSSSSLSSSSSLNLSALKEGSQIFADDNTVNLIHSLADVLQPVTDAVERFAQAKISPPLSLVWNVIENIVDDTTKLTISRRLHKTARDIAYNITQELFTTLSVFAADEAEITLLCTVLDPRFKTPIITGDSKFVMSQYEVTSLLRRNFQAQKKRLESISAVTTTLNKRSANVLGTSTSPEVSALPVADSDSFGYALPPLTLSTTSSPLTTTPQVGPPFIPTSESPEAIDPTQNAVSQQPQRASQSPLQVGEEDGDEEGEEDDEVTRYFLEPFVNHNIDPYTWWSQNRTEYPILAEVARWIFAVPSTSIPSSRAFSISREVNHYLYQQEKNQQQIIEKREMLAKHPQASVAFVQTIAYLNANRHLIDIHTEMKNNNK